MKGQKRARPSFLKSLLFLAVAVAVNCAGGIFIARANIPLYMDSILTIAVTAHSGLAFGTACALLSNGIMYAFDSTMIPFASCHVLTALFAHLVFRRHERLFPSSPLPLEAFLWAGLWSALSNAALGNIIVDLLFSSQSERLNTATPVQGLYIATKNLFFATYLSGFLTNLADKVISALLSFFAYWAASKD